MLLKFSSLIQNNLFLVSRQKTLLKKRKNRSKKQKVAKKKFLEHDPKGSFTHELKILQIKKQLDKKVSKNHHLNELMDELFYPDVRYANQKILEQNLLKMSADPKQSRLNHHGSIKSNKVLEQDEQELDELVEQIYLCQIPSQLFEVYLKNSQIFTQPHLTILIDKLYFYFQNKSTIESKIIFKWKQSLDKLKLIGQQKEKRKKCPYIFIEREDLIRDQNWNKLIKDISKKITLSIKYFPTEPFEQKTYNISQNFSDQSYSSLQQNCNLAIQIKNTAEYLPEQLFNSIVKKTLSILKICRQSNKWKSLNFPVFSHSQKVKLLKVLSLKSQIKSTLTKSLHIESPDVSSKEEKDIVQIGSKICEDILNSPKCTAIDIGIVFESQKGYFKFLNSTLLELTQPKILSSLSKVDLQSAIDYFLVFWQNGTAKNANFIQILLFDIYRKLPYSSSKAHLFNLISIITDGKIVFKQSSLVISISSIYPRIAESIAKYLYNCLLSHEEIKIFVNSIFFNYPLYKASSQINVLEIINTSIIKIGDGYKLEEISQLLFRTVLLGHRSKIFCKYVFERFQKQYKKLMKQYKSSKIQLITDKNIKEQTLSTNYEELSSINEIVLEQNLIMFLWSYVVILQSHQTSLALNDMIQIYPLKIISQDSMITDLIKDLNIQLKQYNFFPLIRTQTLQSKTLNDSTSKINLQSALNQLKTNTYQNYCYRYTKDQALELLSKIEEEKQSFSDEELENLLNYLMRYALLNYNKVKQNSLPNRWNDCVRNLFDIRKESYRKIKEQFLKLSKESLSDEQSNFIQKIQKINQKKQAIQIKKTNKFKTQSPSLKPYKLYQLL